MLARNPFTHHMASSPAPEEVPPPPLDATQRASTTAAASVESRPPLLPRPRRRPCSVAEDVSPPSSSGAPLGATPLAVLLLLAFGLFLFARQQESEDGFFFACPVRHQQVYPVTGSGTTALTHGGVPTVARGTDVPREEDARTVKCDDGKSGTAVTCGDFPGFEPEKYGKGGANDSLACGPDSKHCQESFLDVDVSYYLEEFDGCIGDCMSDVVPSSGGVGGAHDKHCQSSSVDVDVSYFLEFDGCLLVNHGGSDVTPPSNSSENDSTESEFEGHFSHLNVTGDQIERRDDRKNHAMPRISEQHPVFYKNDEATVLVASVGTWQDMAGKRPSMDGGVDVQEQTDTPSLAAFVPIDHSLALFATKPTTNNALVPHSRAARRSISRASSASTTCRPRRLRTGPTRLTNRRR